MQAERHAGSRKLVISLELMSSVAEIMNGDSARSPERTVQSREGSNVSYTPRSMDFDYSVPWQGRTFKKRASDGTHDVRSAIYVAGAKSVSI